jgi:type II restriction enzyme
MRNDIIQLIFKIAKDKDAFDQLEKRLSTITKQQLSSHLIECGILPEMFEHDSSEEKLWAKFSDILLVKALTFLDIEAHVLGARGNSADVFGKTEYYTIVGDAKTFRLSRTAKNQKDFKINALDSWKKGNNYALLVAPLTQYPNLKSQIYAQAIDKNVTLLSYTHLHFLLDFYDYQDLEIIWQTGQQLQNISLQKHQSSDFYWAAIDEVVVKSVGKTLDDLIRYKLFEISVMQKVGTEGIDFWNERINQFNELSREQAIKLLIKSEKIESKIRTIQKAINIKFSI